MAKRKTIVPTGDESEEDIDVEQILEDLEPKPKKPKRPKKPQRQPKQKDEDEDEDDLENEDFSDFDDKYIDAGSLFEDADVHHFDALAQLVNEENIDLKTDLTPGLIVAIAKAEVAAEVFDIPELGKFCQALKAMRVSLDRRGRREIVEALKGHMPEEPDAGMFQGLARLMQ